MPPAWKVRRWHLVIGSSVCPFVRPSVYPSVRNSVPLTNKVQYLKFGWWYSYQTWNVSSSMGSSHFTDPSHDPGVRAGSKCRTKRFFAIFWLCATGGICVSQTHVLFISILMMTQGTQKTDDRTDSRNADYGNGDSRNNQLQPVEFIGVGYRLIYNGSCLLT